MEKQLLTSLIQSLVRQGIIAAATYLGVAEPEKVGLDHTSGVLAALVVALLMAVWSLLTHKKNIATDPKTPKTNVGNTPLMLLLGVLCFGGFATATSMSMTGCGIGQRVRTNVSAPALVYVLPAVSEDAGFGVQAAPPDEQESLRADLTAFEESIRSKDRTRIAFEAYPRWGLVKSLALNGIDFQVENGLVSQPTADMAREHLFRFEVMLNQLATP